MALESLMWLVDKGDTTIEMWKNRFNSEVSAEVKLKE